MKRKKHIKDKIVYLVKRKNKKVGRGIENPPRKNVLERKLVGKGVQCVESIRN